MTRIVFKKFGILVETHNGEYQITINGESTQLTEMEYLIFVGSMDKECNENIDY